MSIRCIDSVAVHRLGFAVFHVCRILAILGCHGACPSWPGYYCHADHVCACLCLCADEIDAIGTKRYDAHSGGEREIQRTMLELLNQLDGFDAISDVKVSLVQAARGSLCGQAGSLLTWMCIQ